MKVKWVSVVFLSSLGVLWSLSTLQSATVGGTASSAQYLPTPRPWPTEMCDTCEPNNSLSRACGPLAPGLVYTYTLRCLAAPASVDDDLYYVDVETPGRVSADLTHIFAGADYNLYLYDQNSRLLAYSVKPGNPDEHLTYDVTKSGRYYVRVYPAPVPGPLPGCSSTDPYRLRVAYPTPPPTPIPTPTPPPPCNNLHIDDFGDSNPINDLGGSSGSVLMPAACGGTFSIDYTGSELKLDYDLPAASACTARYTTTLSPNAASYKMLAFEIKSDAEPELLHAMVGMNDRAGHSARVKVGDWVNRVVTGTWQAVDVPLAAFATAIDISQLDTLFVEFSETQGSRRGTVYLDRLRLEQPRAPIAVDNFDDQAPPNALGGTDRTFSGSGAVITTAYITTGTASASAASFVISYAVPLNEYAVWETALPGLGVSGYDHLSFDIRGASGGEKVNAYLNDGANRRFVDLESYTPVGQTWTPVRIPLSAFTGVTLTRLSSVQIAFEYEPMTGTIYLDDLRFEADSLLADDFCDGDPNNSLAADVGTFTSIPSCAAAATSTLSAGALRLDYDVTAGPGCFSGYYSRALIDLSSYRSLAFQVRGESCGEVAAISANSVSYAPDKVKLSDYLPDGVTPQWQKVTIPLAAYPAVVDWARGDSYAIAFEAGRGASKGTTYWDDVTFNATCSPLWVDNFNDEDNVNALVGTSRVFADPEAVMTMTTSITQALGDTGAGLALTYSVPSNKYAAWETPLPSADVSDYGWLAFSIKRGGGSANPNVYLMDSSNKRRFVNLENYASLTTEWQPILIPLRDFGDIDLTRLQNLQLVMEFEPVAIQGVFYLDNIRFLPSSSCSLRSPSDTFLPLVAKNYAPSTPGLNPIWDFETGTDGWTYQTYTNSQAIVSVERASNRWFTGTASLGMVVDLIGGDANRGKGEALVDVSNTPPPGTTAPLNLACKPVSCRVYLPTCGLGNSATPNQVQLFVKDVNGKSEYGSPMRVVTDQWFEVKLRPSPQMPDSGYVDPGFAPAAIDQFGIRFMAPDGSQSRYRGKVYLDACGWQEIDPPLGAAASACIPGTTDTRP